MWWERPGRSDAVRTVWAAEVEAVGSYLLAGSEYWGISFIRGVDGALAAELDGPSLAARSVDSVLGESYWGVELEPSVVVRGLDTSGVLGVTVRLGVRDGRVRVGEDWSPIPGVDGLEAWVDERIRAGSLVADDELRAALGGSRVGATERTWQRRFRRGVGLTAAQVEQVKRAERAYALLQSGLTPSEAAAAAGFADQAHLTRSFRLIRGRTPAAVLAAARDRPDRG